MTEKYQQNAHSSGVPVIHYRYHPCFGQAVELVRPFDRDHLLVRVQDQVQFVIPRWMFDTAACEVLYDADVPRISLDALRALRSLLDAQDSLRPTATSAVASVREKGASHGASAASATRSSTEARLRGG